MRTDGVQLSQDAIGAARRLIDRDYGEKYCPKVPRQYKTVAKNAQEAHEAVRPTDMFRRPADVARFLDADMLRLYELIWKRTMASQMESAVMDQVTVDINGAAGRATFRATGSVIVFDGFLKLYQEGRDDDGADEQDRRLPPLNEKDGLDRGEIVPAQHFTEPPPRYTEASLVKKMEELGIGRPSTYASIIQVLQDRDYVKLDRKRFIPEDRGRLVIAFLENFFERYVQYNFTADLENLLDEISGGRADWKEVLRKFWLDFSFAIDGTKDLTITQVLEALDRELGNHLFPEDGTGRDPRLCPACQKGQLSLKLGKFGAFVGCANYPECRFTRPLTSENGGDQQGAELGETGPKSLGTNPDNGLPVSLRKGPYGVYFQEGEAAEGFKPKRVSLPKGMKSTEATLEQALALLALPREIGTHPETGTMITAGIGRFGPYVKHGSTYKSLPADDDVLTIGINRAVSLLAEQSKGGKNSPTPLRILGEHPTEGGNIGLFKGRYGPYVEHRGLFASLPRGGDPETLTLEDALALLAAQIAKGKKPKPQRGAKAAPAAKKKTTTKAAATKSATAKPAAKPKAKAKPKPKAAAKVIAAPPAEPAPKLRRKTVG